MHTYDLFFHGEICKIIYYHLQNTHPNRDGVMVMCNGNALQCITIFKVMGSNVGFYHYM